MATCLTNRVCWRVDGALRGVVGVAGGPAGGPAGGSGAVAMLMAGSRRAREGLAATQHAPDALVLLLNGWPTEVSGGVSEKGAKEKSGKSGFVRWRGRLVEGLVGNKWE